MIETISIFDFFIIGLATWRLSSLLVKERGLFSIFLVVRLLTGMQYCDARNNYTIKGYLKDKDIRQLLGGMFEELDHFTPTELSKLLSCVWCTSMWIALLNVLAYTKLTGDFYDTYMFFNLWLSFSTMAILIDGRTQ